MPGSEIFSEFAPFQVRVGPLVAADPVGATVFDSVLTGQLAAPEPGPAPLMVVVTERDAVLAAAIRITDHPMIVVLDRAAADPAAALAELTAAVVADGAPVAGFTGRRVAVQLLAQQWSRLTGAAVRARMSFLLHRLGTLVPPVDVPGTARDASVQDPADLDLLANWWFAFDHETGVNAAGPAIAPDPDGVLLAAHRGQVVILWWNDGRPVAAAGHSAVRDGLARIAPVYTPPEFRRRGYASAVTAAAVRSARAAGASEITLFTDADYAPANAVYRQLGFDVVAEFAEFVISGS